MISVICEWRFTCYAVLLHYVAWPHAVSGAAVVGHFFKAWRWGRRRKANLQRSFTFDTFPFPWPPGSEPSEDADPRVRAIPDAARELVRLRDAWLNPPGIAEADLKDRTLTKLYNERPQ
jgi:hypothetical protein